MIAQARVVGWRAWLSLYSSTTTLAPRVAYCSSRRTHAYSSAGDRSRAGSALGLSAKHRIQSWGGRLAGALVGGGDGALADRFRVTGGHAEAVAGEGFAQRRPGGAQLGRGGVNAAEPLGELEGAFGLGPVGKEPAGLPAHPPRSTIGCSALAHPRVSAVAAASIQRPLGRRPVPVAAGTCRRRQCPQQRTNRPDTAVQKQQWTADTAATSSWPPPGHRWQITVSAVGLLAALGLRQTASGCPAHGSRRTVRAACWSVLANRAGWSRYPSRPPRRRGVASGCPREMLSSRLDVRERAEPSSIGGSCMAQRLGDGEEPGRLRGIRRFSKHVTLTRLSVIVGIVASLVGIAAAFGLVGGDGHSQRSSPAAPPRIGACAVGSHQYQPPAAKRPSSNAA
jgi:hypothetical protein